MQITNSTSRRTILQALMSTVVVPVGEHGGRIKPPIPAPDISLGCQNGRKTRLPQLLQGHGTALQVMFAQCQTPCPMQGAIFERAQHTIPDMASRKLQLVSLSIDPAHDTPGEMTQWLRRFHAGPAWIGAAPAMKDLRVIQDFFGQGRAPIDDHSTQVHIFNRDAQLIWRTIELPSAEEIATILIRL